METNTQKGSLATGSIISWYSIARRLRVHVSDDSSSVWFPPLTTRPHCSVGGQIGNGDDKLFMNDIWKFDPKTETWSEIKCQGNFPEGRTSLNATAIGDNLFLFGGLIKGTGSKEGENIRADDAYVFNFKGMRFRYPFQPRQTKQRGRPIDCTWRSLAMMGDSPPPSKRGALLPLGSKLIVIGGQTSKLQRVYVAETQDGKSLSRVRVGIYENLAQQLSFQRKRQTTVLRGYSSLQRRHSLNSQPMPWT